MDYIIKSFQEQFKNLIVERKDLTLFLGLISLFLLWGYPVINADVLHQDDIYRALTGNYDWYGLGRPLAAEASRIVSASGFVLLDVAPYTQILSLLLLSYSAFLVYKYFQKKYELNLFFSVALILFNPYFLYNLYYRFDSIGMSLGLLFTILAFISKDPPLKKSIFPIGYLVAGLACYQPIINLYIAFLAIEILVLSKHANFLQVSLRLIQYSAIYCISYLLYYLSIGLIVSSRTERTSLVSFDENILASIVSNLDKFIAYAMKIYHLPSFMIVILVLLGIGIFSCRNKFSSAGPLIPTAILAVLVSVISLSGPLFILDSTLVHYRTIPTLFVFLSVLIVFFILLNNKLDKMAIIPIFLSISFSYQLGNLYKTQRHFEAAVINDIAFELSKVTLPYKEVFVMGEVEQAPFGLNIRKNNPVINDMVPPATGWQLDGLLIGAGVKGLPFLWGGERREKQNILKVILCASKDLIFRSNKFNVYSVDETVVVTVGELQCDGVEASNNQ
jgi:hypothetical protein